MAPRPIPTDAQRAAFVRSFFSLAITLAVMAVLLFGPAGPVAWPRALWFLVVFTFAMVVAIAVIWRFNPDLFVARSRVQPGTKAWDYVFLVSVIGGFAAILPAAALDHRAGGANAPSGVIVAGYVLFVLSFAGQVWPQAMNRFFEPGVRRQEDRGQTVIDTGPYAIVRHPGYISGSLLGVSIALALGSYWALVPAAVVVLALLPRTVLEERMLRAELPGYEEYTRRVRYRWIPGVW